MVKFFFQKLLIPLVIFVFSIGCGITQTPVVLAKYGPEILPKLAYWLGPNSQIYLMTQTQVYKARAIEGVAMEADQTPGAVDGIFGFIKNAVPYISEVVVSIFSNSEVRTVTLVGLIVFFLITGRFFSLITGLSEKMGGLSGGLLTTTLIVTGWAAYRINEVGSSQTFEAFKPLLWIIVFAVAAAVGYFLIKELLEEITNQSGIWQKIIAILVVVVLITITLGLAGGNTTQVFSSQAETIQVANPAHFLATTSKFFSELWNKWGPLTQEFFVYSMLAVLSGFGAYVFYKGRIGSV